MECRSGDEEGAVGFTAWVQKTVKGDVGSEATFAMGVVVGYGDQSLRLTAVTALPPLDQS